MKFIIVAYYGLGDSQVAWTGRRWINDVSVAEVYETDGKARSAFRQLAARGKLQHRDCAVVVEDYGLVTERIVYYVDADGRVAAGSPAAAAS